MGRQIRRVPPHWVHPKATEEDVKRGRYGARQVGDDLPMFDEDYDTAAERWIAEFKAWEAKPEADRFGCKYYWEWDSPPNPDMHRPRFTEEATWFQVYQNVSEGSPVSPAFATEAELIDYLAAHGDFWDQKRGTPPPSREAAERFVRGGYAPSMVMAGGRTLAGIHSAELLSDD